MLPRSLFLLLLPVLLGSSQAAIDLTPAVAEQTEDGATFAEVSFRTPAGKWMFVLPPGWTIRGQKDRAQLTSANRSAEAAIEATPLQKPEPLDESAIAKFKQQVVAGLPVGTTKLVTVSEAENTIMPGGYPSFEFVITYNLWGKNYQKSALLVNGPQDRLTFRFTCLQSDFMVLNTHFRRSLMTWHAVEGKEPPQTAIAAAGTSRPGTN